MSITRIIIVGLFVCLSVSVFACPTAPYAPAMPVPADSAHDAGECGPNSCPLPRF